MKTQRHTQWMTLHRQYEQYEMLALVIKLVAVLMTFGGLGAGLSLSALLLLLAVLWLQEGIWKTFQTRLQTSLLVLEQSVAQDDGLLALYSNWQQQSRSSVSLLLEYVRSSLRPTVAFPYIVLMGVAAMPQIPL